MAARIKRLSFAEIWIIFVKTLGKSERRERGGFAMRSKIPIYSTICVLFAFLLANLCDTAFGANESETKGGTAKMQIQSSAFKEGATIPKKHTCDGEDISPALSWSAAPAGTKSLVLICDDPDAPVGTWVHWVLFGLRPDTTALPEDVPKKDEVLAGAKQGRNDFRKIGYGGPCPPAGKPHRYFFKLYAIDVEPQLKVGATKAEVMKAVDGHILAEAQLMGRYGR